MGLARGPRPTPPRHRGRPRAVHQRLRPQHADFYPRFDHIVLLAAPPEVLVERLATRTTNTYGKTPEQLAEVLHNQRTVEPLLRRRATLELDATKPLDDLVEALANLAPNP